MYDADDSAIYQLKGIAGKFGITLNFIDGIKTESGDFFSSSPSHTVSGGAYTAGYAGNSIDGFVDNLSFDLIRNAVVAAGKIALTVGLGFFIAVELSPVLAALFVLYLFLRIRKSAIQHLEPVLDRLVAWLRDVV